MNCLNKLTKTTLLLFLISLFFVTVTKGGDIPTPGPNPSKYDVNKDGIANLTDLLLLIQGVFKY